MERECSTDLFIIGAGAAGLMAGVRAGEMGLKCVLVERKHLAGRKLLMCGNARCNLTSDLSPADMIKAYGEPISSFLETAIKRFSPSSLQRWMKENGLATSVHKDKRVFPASERAPDVLRLFTDLLRNYDVPIMFNSAVTGTEKCDAGWRVIMPNCELCAKNVLIATGGVSYPKSGSVGDGQNMARDLGHKLQPYRPGLVGYEVEETWLTQFPDVGFHGTALSIINKQGRVVGETAGEVRCERWGLTGPAVVNASRLIARRLLAGYTFKIDLFPSVSREELAEQFSTRQGRLERKIAEMGISSIISKKFCDQVLSGCKRSGKEYDADAIAERLKNWMLHPVKSRSLKEAMVTVGGVDLSEIDADTMESRCVSGLYFAGEVMDVDGPTGGYNLQAAFSTARLAVESVAEKMGIKGSPRLDARGKERKNRKNTFRGGARRRNRRR